MSTLQSYSDQSNAFDEGGRQRFRIDDYLDILKRRIFYFVIPFSLVLFLGSVVTAIQRPIYQAEGKILVETQQIPTDLVQPTVTDTANERIQVIQQRIMTRDNLLALVNKYRMFQRERQWMSDTELLDLMRQRTQFQLVDINGRPGNATIAFVLSFDYENPDVTLQVTNDFLTLILSEDARNRTNRATETTEFLSHELQRLQGLLAAIQAQIAQAKISPQETADTVDPARMELSELTKLKAELAQKSAVYSAEHPVIKDLKKNIAAMEQLIAHTPTPAPTQADNKLDELQRQELATETSLESANKKLEAARLGEQLERNQQSERLQVIEQPVLPRTPIKPNRIKLLTLSFALAMAVGAGIAFAAETFDPSIRHSHELAAVTNGRLIVSIPYIATHAETFRRKSRLTLMIGMVGILLVAGVVGLLFFGPPIDLSWINQFWLDHLRALSK